MSELNQRELMRKNFAATQGGPTWFVEWLCAAAETRRLLAEPPLTRLRVTRDELRQVLRTLSLPDGSAATVNTPGGRVALVAEDSP